MSDIADHDITGLNNKLLALSTDLTPGERKVFDTVLSAAREKLTAEVQGYDSGGSDLVSKINWDQLTTFRVTPSPVGDREFGGGGNR